MEVASLLRLVSDQRLAEHVAAGSDRAFEVLYDRHARPILTFCRHLLGSREEAEDALQHTFMAAYRDLLRSGPPAAVRPWLFVIARNHCISLLRARRELPSAELPERGDDRLGSDVATREELRSVFAALSRLPDDQRAALVLAELGDASHDEIAQILDCRREQVKSYVYQARAALAADRLARDTSCADIRAQLSELNGRQLRRTPLRRHLDGCPGCREFRDALRAQRRQLRVLLPVAPTFGLKRAVLGAVLGGAGGGGGAVGVAGLAATALVVVAIPAGGVAVVRDDPPPVAAVTRESATDHVRARGPQAPSGAPVRVRSREATVTSPEQDGSTRRRGEESRPGDEPPTSDEPRVRHDDTAADDRPGDETSRGDDDAPGGDEPPGRDTPRSDQPRGDDAPRGGEAPGDDALRDESSGDDSAPGDDTPRSGPPGRDAPRGNEPPSRNSSRGEKPDAPPGQNRPPAEAPGNAPATPPGQSKPRGDTPGNAPQAPPGQTKPRDDTPGNAPQAPPGQTKPPEEPAKAPPAPPGQTKPADQTPGNAPATPPGQARDKPGKGGSAQVHVEEPQDASPGVLR